MSAESEAKRALSRLRRALEKAERELDAVSNALAHAEGQDFPSTQFTEAAASMHELQRFIDEQEERLADKILHAGGLEPGRIRRT